MFQKLVLKLFVPPKTKRNQGPRVPGKQGGPRSGWNSRGGGRGPGFGQVGGGFGQGRAPGGILSPTLTLVDCLPDEGKSDP